VERDQLGLDRVYLLRSGTDVAGYFFLWEFDHPAPLLGIGLADAWQGQGLGGPMLALLIKDARDAGRAAVELTTVLTNDRALRLYEHAGFRQVGVVENLAGDGRVVRERRMFLALKPGATPADRDFKPPF
jgi:ribosomal protein S18 acetylase RimI-like enzyme